MCMPINRFATTPLTSSGPLPPATATGNVCQTDPTEQSTPVLQPNPQAFISKTSPNLPEVKSCDQIQGEVDDAIDSSEPDLGAVGVMNGLGAGESSELQNNLAVGTAVMNGVAGSIVSSNKAGSIGEGLLSAVAFLPNVGSRVRQHATDPDPKLDAPPPHVTTSAGSYQELHHIARIAKAHAVGNCGEKAAATAVDLADRGIKPVEVFITMSEPPADDLLGAAAQIFDGHAFTVIGRDPNSKINDPSTWGPNAVIVDAWYEEVYPASEIRNHMGNAGNQPGWLGMAHTVSVADQ